MQTLQPAHLPTFDLKTDWQSELSEHLGTLRLRDRSVALARQHITLFAAWYEAQFNKPFNPRQITGYAISAYRHHSLNEARVAARTWNSRWWALHILCQWGGCPSAMDGIEQKQTTGRSEIHRRLQDDEYHRLHETLELRILPPVTLSKRRILAAVTLFEHRDRVRDRAAVLLMLEAGLRVDEVAQLDKTDIRLTERRGIILVRHGKGGKERKAGVNLVLRKALTAWLDQRQDENPALFDGKATDRLSTRSIQRIIEDLRADTRIPDLRCHSLRFDFAKRTEKRLIKKGFGRSEIIRIIMDLLGHADSATTEDYLVSSMDELMSAVEEE